MLISAEIFKETATSTLTKIFIDGEWTGLYGLEDGFREEKVMHETRIPRGKYQVTVREFGGFHGRYSDRFDFHQGMLEVADVEGFTDVLIHVGNFVKDSSGCLLIGTDYGREGDNFFVKSSSYAYSAFYKEVIGDALCRTLYIEYK